MKSPEIRKCKLIIGNKLIFRDALEEDAEFILSLRVDEKKSKFLSRTEPNIEKQIEWLHNYASSQNQAYFIIGNRAGEPVGTVRLYDAQQDSFCWGSWLMIHGCPSSFAIESALIVYHYGLLLGFKRSHFDVRKGNKSVCQFHEKFGAVKIGETAEDYFYSIEKAAIIKSLNRYERYLPKPVQTDL